jgi:hypothetical protein
MTSSHDDRPRLDREEEAFVARVAQSYAPPPLSASQRAALDDALSARLQRPPRRGLFVPVLAAAAVAGLLLLTFSPSLDLLRGTRGEDTVVASNTVVASVWEAELFLSSDVSASEGRDEGEGLPEDYLAIERIFLGS